MRLATLARPPHGRSAAMIGEQILDLGLAGAVLPIARWIPQRMADVLSGGDEGLAIVRRLVSAVEDASDRVTDDLKAEGALLPTSDNALMAPVPAPGILLSHARAYRDHVAEMSKGDAVPEYPVGFSKNVHSIVGPGARIQLPTSAGRMVDFEGELAIVFSRNCHGISADEAFDHVLGFTIVNDVSARDWVPEMKSAPDRNRMGKQFPSFSPMGPWITTIDEVDDPNDLHLVTRVNGEVMQDARTSDLIWSIPLLIEYYSRWYPFQAGDVLTTGSPAGVGYGRDPKRFLSPGDTVSITVDQVGTLTNVVAAAVP